MCVDQTNKTAFLTILSDGSIIARGNLGQYLVEMSDRLSDGHAIHTLVEGESVVTIGGSHVFWMALASAVVPTMTPKQLRKLVLEQIEALDKSLVSIYIVDENSPLARNRIECLKVRIRRGMVEERYAVTYMCRILKCKNCKWVNICQYMGDCDGEEVENEAR